MCSFIIIPVNSYFSYVQQYCPLEWIQMKMARENVHLLVGSSFVPQKRRLRPEDPFYEDGNIQCSVQHKQMPMEEEDQASQML